MNSKHFTGGPKSLKQDQLKQGLELLHLTCNDKQINQLLNYLDLLERWNKAYNLTAIRDPFDMINLHLLDSLAISAELQGERFIDVGTGPGLPGIPLAIINQNKNFTLLDSNGKKTRFMQQAKIELGLKNINVVNSRVEMFRPEGGFDIVVSRAFSSLKSFSEITQHLCSDEGMFYAMKGKCPLQEMDEMAKGFKVLETYKLQVPGLDNERHLVVFEQSQPN